VELIFVNDNHVLKTGLSKLDIIVITLFGFAEFSLCLRQFYVQYRLNLLYPFVIELN